MSVGHAFSATPKEQLPGYINQDEHSTTLTSSTIRHVQLNRKMASHITQLGDKAVKQIQSEYVKKGGNLNHQTKIMDEEIPEEYQETSNQDSNDAGIQESKTLKHNDSIKFWKTKDKQKRNLRQTISYHEVASDHEKYPVRKTNSALSYSNNTKHQETVFDMSTIEHTLHTNEDAQKTMEFNKKHDIPHLDNAAPLLVPDEKIALIDTHKSTDSMRHIPQPVQQSHPSHPQLPTNPSKKPKPPKQLTMTEKKKKKLKPWEKEDFYHLQIRVKKQDNIEDNFFDVKISQDESEELCLVLQNLKVNAEHAIIFQQPDNTTLSPCNVLPWIKEPKELLNHSLRIIVYGTFPHKTRVAESVIKYQIPEQELPPSETKAISPPKSSTIEEQQPPIETQDESPLPSTDISPLSKKKQELAALREQVKNALKQNT